MLILLPFIFLCQTVLGITQDPRVGSEAFPKLPQTALNTERTTSPHPAWSGEAPGFDNDSQHGGHVSMRKMIKNGMKVVRRFVRQSLSELPDSRKGGITEILEDIIS